MSDNAVKFALVGCGRISQVHLTTLGNEARADLIAVADVDASAAEGAAEAYSAKAYTDPVRMFEAEKPEAVILCSPPNTHRELAMAALASGSHVLCEKPLAITVEDAQAMVDAAREADRTLMMASKFRYMDSIIKARAILQSGILGEVILFENEFCAHVDMRNRWNSVASVSGGGVLIDNGSHSVDVVRYLCGPIQSLQALRGKQWQEIEVEDTCRVFARCEDGTTASIDLSWSIHKESAHFIHIYGTAGTLEIGWQGSRYRQSSQLDWVPFGSPYNKFDAVGSQLANFIDTLQGKGRPRITTEDALESVRVVQSAYASAEQNRWEPVNA